MSSLTDYEDTLLASSPALALALANAYEMGRAPQPNYQPSAEAMEEAFMDTEAVKDVEGYDFIRKDKPSRVDAYQNPDDYGFHEKVSDENGYTVRYNPSAHRAYLAHEMGHTAAQQSQPGKFISDAREQTQRFANRTVGAGLSGSIAALTPGDDDMAASILSSYLASSPVIADELMASLKAQEILRQSHNGVIPKGSRIRLAGALGSYLATPAMAGAVANYAGNLVDDEIVGPPTNTANVA